MLVRAAICDDNEKALDMLRRMTDSMLAGQGLRHSIDCFSGSGEFLEAHRREPFDVVFLDIIMPQGDGFSAAEELRRISGRTYIIFVTSESSLVYDSFDFSPFCFVPKNPADLFAPRLSHAIEKLAVHMSDGKPVFLELPYGEKRYIKPAEIITVRSRGNYTEYLLTSGECVQLRGKTDDAARALPERLFVRIHNRYIVNMGHIKRVDYPNSRVIMSDGSEAAVSRSFRKDFDERYLKYIRELS